jgi:hypothetical protein
MAIPFASAYAPINTLNAAIQAQDQARRQGSLAWQQMNEQSVSDALNRAVQQKALQQQAALQQQHYGLQQQQLANDLAYRNQALGLTQAQQAEGQRQFNERLGLEKKIADAQIGQMNSPWFGMGRERAALLDADATSAGLASQINIDLQGAKKSRDDALEEIKRVQKSGAIGDVWTDVKTSNANWANQILAINEAYRKRVSDITTAAQGRVIVRRKAGSGPNDDDFEAVPMQLVSRNVMPETPTPAPDLGPFPAAWPRPAATTGGGMPEIREDAAVQPTPNPFSGLSYGTGTWTGLGGPATPQPWVNPVFNQFLRQNVRTNAPPVQAVSPNAVTNRILRYNPQTGLLMPVQ